MTDSWNQRSQNLHRKAHLLTKAELKARGITRYDAEMLIAQGLPLPKLRLERKYAAATCTSNTELTPTSSTSFNHQRLTGNPTTNVKEADQKVPKLKLRRQKFSDTETDSSGTTSCDTPQPLYEILPSDFTDNSIVPLQPSEYSQDTCISSINENTNSQTSFKELLSEAHPTCTAEAQDASYVKRLTLKIGGELVKIVNVSEQKS